MLLILNGGKKQNVWSKALVVRGSLVSSPSHPRNIGAAGAWWMRTRFCGEAGAFLGRNTSFSLLVTLDTAQYSSKLEKDMDHLILLPYQLGLMNQGVWQIDIVEHFWCSMAEYFYKSCCWQAKIQMDKNIPHKLHAMVFMALFIIQTPMLVSCWLVEYFNKIQDMCELVGDKVQLICMSIWLYLLYVTMGLF